MRVRIEQYEDWARLFVDDKLVDAGHSVRSDQLLAIIVSLGAEAEEVQYMRGDEDVPYDDKPNPEQGIVYKAKGL